MQDCMKILISGVLYGLFLLTISRLTNLFYFSIFTFTAGMLFGAEAGIWLRERWEK